MRPHRNQFTMRRMMVTIAIVALVLAYMVHRERRIRKLDRMLKDQTITVGSAIANVGNAELVREAAEYALRQQWEKEGGAPEEVSLSVASHTEMSGDQPRPLASLELDRADAEERFARIVQQLNDGTYADAAVAAPITAKTAIKQYVETHKRHVQATRAADAGGAQGPGEKARIDLQRKLEEARLQEQVKKMILDYEKAYLKSLRRERANSWW